MQSLLLFQTNFLMDIMKYFNENRVLVESNEFKRKYHSNWVTKTLRKRDVQFIHFFYSWLVAALTIQKHCLQLMDGNRYLDCAVGGLLQFHLASAPCCSPHTNLSCLQWSQQGFASVSTWRMPWWTTKRCLCPGLGERMKPSKCRAGGQRPSSQSGLGS